MMLHCYLLDDLSDEIIEKIVFNLKVKDFQSLLLTNKYFSIFNNEKTWEIISGDLGKYKPLQKSYKWLALAMTYSYKVKFIRGGFENAEYIFGNFKSEKEYWVPEGFALVNVNNMILSGYFVDGFLQGQGRMWTENGIYYEGNFEKGHEYGYGIMIWPNNEKSALGGFANNEKYEGEFVDCQLHGKGKYYFSDGSLYEGDFKNNQFTGYAILYNETETSKGWFLDLKRHGYQEVTWRNGMKYLGNFENNEKSGYGEYYWPSGAFYKGNWKHDLRSGNGKASWKNGLVYEGNYVNDKRNGYGTLTWPNGDKYIGVWNNGSRKGSGILILTDGTEIKQSWNEPDDMQYTYFIPKKF